MMQSYVSDEEYAPIDHTVRKARDGCKNIRKKKRETAHYKKWLATDEK